MISLAFKLAHSLSRSHYRFFSRSTLAQPWFSLFALVFARWNFAKFLIGRDGKPIKRWTPGVSTNDPGNPLLLRLIACVILRWIIAICLLLIRSLRAAKSCNLLAVSACEQTQQCAACVLLRLSRLEQIPLAFRSMLAFDEHVCLLSRWCDFVTGSCGFACRVRLRTVRVC